MAHWSCVILRYQPRLSYVWKHSLPHEKVFQVVSFLTNNLTESQPYQASGKKNLSVSPKKVRAEFEANFEASRTCQ